MPTSLDNDYNQSIEYHRVKKMEQELDSLKSHHEITHSIIEDTRGQSPVDGKALLSNMANLKERVKGLEDLVRQVRSWHADPESPSFNDCTNDNICKWCGMADYVLSLGKRNETETTLEGG